METAVVALVNIGIIYRLTAPDGRKYIGQTTDPFNERMRNHKSDSTHKDYYLYQVMREFGFDSFTKEIILECDIKLLDFHEISYIKNEGTLRPNGLNSKPGGHFIHSKFEDLPKELQQFYSDNIRKHTNYILPPGISELHLPERGEFGFKVYRVYPDGRKVTHDFNSKHQTMEEKYHQALECHKVIYTDDNTEYKRINGQKWHKERVAGFDVPEGVKYRADKDGWEVHIKLEGMVKPYRKCFTKKKFTKSENLQSAIQHMNKVKEEHANKVAANPPN